MPDYIRELEELKQQVAQLTARLHTLEQAAGLARPAPAGVPPAGPSLAAAPRPPAPPAPPKPVAPAASMPARTPAAPPPSLESKIGAQWLNRIGIVAVLIGVSYFLKYAFENNWIGPTGRIAIGLLAGAGVVLWSESFRKHGYRVFSYSLKALGVGILYLSLWGAFQIYHLIPSEAAFAGMVLVTGFTATLALKEDAEIIAAFAVAGAFSTPLLLSTGENHEVALFSYVTLLDVAVLALIAYKPWKRLLMGAFFGTLILYAGWSDRYYNSSELETTLLFASTFFVVFAIAPLVAGSAAAAKSMTAAPPVSLIIVSGLNAVAYFLQIVAMLDYMPSKDSQPLLAWAAVAIAAIYIVLSRMIQQRLAGEKSAALIPLLYLAIAVGFLTIAVPLKMNAHWVTIGWFIESAVLMWIGERTDRDLLRFFGVAAVALGVLRLVFYDNFHPTRLIFNAVLPPMPSRLQFLLPLSITRRGTPSTVEAPRLR